MATKRGRAWTHHVSRITVSLLIVAVLLAGSVDAQDLDPRRYVNVPVAQNFVGLGFTYSEGDVNVSPSVPYVCASGSAVLDGERLSRDV